MHFGTPAGCVYIYIYIVCVVREQGYQLNWCEHPTRSNARQRTKRTIYPVFKPIHSQQSEYILTGEGFVVIDGRVPRRFLHKELFANKGYSGHKHSKTRLRILCKCNFNVFPVRTIQYLYICISKSVLSTISPSQIYFNYDTRNDFADFLEMWHKNTLHVNLRRVGARKLSWPHRLTAPSAGETSHRHHFSRHICRTRPAISIYQGSTHFPQTCMRNTYKFKEFAVDARPSKKVRRSEILGKYESTT